MIYSVVLILFILLLSILKKLKLNSLRFLIGTVCGFIICITILRSPIEQVIRYYFMNIISFIFSPLSHVDVYKEVSALIIKSAKGELSLVINHECLGLMEHITYTILVLFLPFIKGKRLLYILLGNMYLLAANVTRMFLIVELVKCFGVENYSMIHGVWMRILFFILILLLFFFVFTRNHMSNQKMVVKNYE